MKTFSFFTNRELNSGTPSHSHPLPNFPKNNGSAESRAWCTDIRVTPEDGSRQLRLSLPATLHWNTLARASPAIWKGWRLALRANVGVPEGLS